MSQKFIFKAEYFMIAFCFMLLAPFSVGAQGSDVKPVEGVVVANIRLSDAAILSHEPGKVSIGFSLTNQGDTTQLDIRYGFELIRTTGDGQQVIADTFVSPETLALAPGQALNKKAEYFAPTFLSGEYKIYVIAKTTGGQMLGLGKAGKVTFSEDAPYVEILPESCVLNIKSDDKNYTLYQGVDLDLTEKLSITCDIENHFNSEEIISQNFETFRRSLYGESIATDNFQKETVTISAKGRKTVSFSVPLATNPQAYDTTLILVDSITKTPVSNKISFHYVLRGESATIQNVTFDKSSYVAGDTISANVSWTPSADQFPGSRAGSGTEIDKITALLSVSDNKGNSCAESVPKFISTETLNFIITANANTDCVDAVATVSLIDKNHNTLDSLVIGSLKQSGPSLTSEELGLTQGQFNSINYKIIALVLTFLLISGLIMLIKRSSHNKDIMSDTNSPYKILIYILLFSSGLFVGAGEVNAVTFSGQGNVWQFTADTNKTTYSPSETIYLDSAIYANVCGNTASNVYLEATLENINISLQSGFISGGQSLYGSGQFTAPTTPGSYLIVLKGCGGDLCYANPPQGVFYSSLPITVSAPPMAPNAWWSPSNITVASGGNYTFGYSSLGAAKCDIWKNGTLVSKNAPTWYTFSNMIANEPSYVSKLICYSATGVPSNPVNFTLTVVQPAVNGSCGNADNVQSLVVPTFGLCSAGSPSSVVSNTNSYNWSCFGQSGGTNDSCSAAKPSAVNANINASNCVIPLNGNNCSSNSVTWSSTNATAPSIRQDGIEFSTNQGPRSESRTIGYGSHTFSFYDNNVLVISDFAEAFCVAGTTWNSGVSKCVAAAAPDLVPSFNPTGAFNVGTAIPLTGTVKNIGTLNAGNFSDNFSFWNGASWVDITPYIAHQSLSSGGSQAIDTGTYTPTLAGPLQLQYCVDSFNQIINESSESNCVQVTVNVLADTSNAVLNGYGCTIPLGGSSCDGKFTWDIQGLSPNVRNLTTNTQYSTSPTGNNVLRPLQYGNNVVAARSNTNTLKTVEVIASCVAGTAWNNTICEFAQMPPQITIEANPNTIRTGQTTPVIVRITAGYNMNCTVNGVNLTADTFTHIGGSTEKTYNYTTRPLTSSQVVQISCTAGATITTKQARIEIIGTVQEI